MAGEGGREGPEVSRRIRDELERIREAESRVEEALETVRQARRRVEVVARELAREEERVRAWVRDEIKAAGGATEPGIGWSAWRESAARPPDQGPRDQGPPSASAPVEPRPAEAHRAAPPRPEARILPPTAEARTLPPEAEARILPPTAEARSLPPVAEARPLPPAAIPVTATAAADRTTIAGWNRHVALGLMAALAVALVGWFAIRGLRRQAAGEPAVAVAADTVAPAPSAAPPITEPPAPAAASPLAELPQDAAARQSLYDSLFAARSPLFDPLLATIQSEAGDKGVQRALNSWKSGPVDAQDADLIHSALLQHVLKADVDPRIEVDGQVLRNPCRGRSCSAVLDVWAHQQAKYGLPPVPDNAPTDPRALRQAEAVLVLGWLRDASAGSAASAVSSPG